ncbi:hypothetical protein KFK09_002942 [Dendrobium nobile]|uniref:Carbonic anhydrase n=1 Tax=Dendrobium nobile TaxID=94219 RepID=A0A8T3C8B0_DENNO|nr:hypothetical protein KFK09_002942 [Dendrobium nobile]
MEVSKKLFLIMAMVAFLYINDASVEQEEFSYKRGAWNGPEHWGDINKDWETCKTGRMQSPVAVDDKNIIVAQQPEDLQWSYYPKNAVMMNHGHAIVIEWKDEAGAVWINKTEYSLKQVHWHMPSENTINGHRFDLEVHMLHQRTTDQKMAMISNLYKIGNPDPFFTKVEKYIGAISRKMDAKVEIGIIDPKEISRVIDKYYRLKGSITIPPCTEGVTWTINRNVRTISVEQLKSLKEAAVVGYERNARPLQPLNGREVELFA